MRVHVRIERLVLDSLLPHLTPGAVRRIARTTEGDLLALIRTGGVGELPVEDTTLPRVSGGAFRLGDGDPTRRIGGQVARTIARTLTRSEHRR